MSTWTSDKIAMAREVVALNKWRANGNQEQAMLLELATIGLRVVDPSPELVQCVGDALFDCYGGYNDATKRHFRMMEDYTLERKARAALKAIMEHTK